MPLSPTPLRPGPRPRRLAAAFAGLSAAALLGACGEQGQHQTQNEPTRTVTQPPPGSTPPPGTTTVPAPHHATSGTPAPGRPGLDPRFRTCKEANAHGYYDYVRGVDPEYYWYTDRDHDGIDCEPGEVGISPPSSPTKSPSPFTESPSSPTGPPSSPTGPPSSPIEPPSPPSQEPSTPIQPPPPPTEEPSPPAPSQPPPTEGPSAPSSGDEQNPPHSSDQPPAGEPFANPSLTTTIAHHTTTM